MGRGGEGGGASTVHLLVHVGGVALRRLAVVGVLVVPAAAAAFLVLILLLLLLLVLPRIGICEARQTRKPVSDPSTETEDAMRTSRGR